MLLRQFAGWIFGLLLWAIKLTCRREVLFDPRPALRAAHRPYLYALLHAHQFAAVVINDEERLAAMVSRSADGELLVPALRLRRVMAVRGSTRRGKRDKGGGEALQGLAALLRQGIPGLLAVDGPRGPRNRVHAGVAKLAQQENAMILPVLVLPSRRWFLSRTWDRFQIPKPFSRIRLIFGPPIQPTLGESVDALRQRVGQALFELERQYDPTESPASASSLL